MKFLSLLCLWLLASLSLLAHPGIGLIYDGQQTIYYTDLAQVWKVDTETGAQEIMIPNIHTHELYLDAQGNLYGEHYWYEASQEKFWNYVWRYTPAGSFEKIRPDQEGENEDFSFVRDREMGGFFIREHAEHHQIVRQDSAGETIWQSLDLHHPSWKYLNHDGKLLFVDYPALYSVQANGMHIISSELTAARFPFSFQDTRHHLFGIWEDEAANTYVASYGGRVVYRIDGKGTVERVYKSSLLWSPVNGVFDKEGNLWLLEGKIGGKVRVRKIEQEDWGYAVSFWGENALLLGGFLLLLGGGWWGFRRRRRKQVASLIHV